MALLGTKMLVRADLINVKLLASSLNAIHCSQIFGSVG